MQAVAPKEDLRALECAAGFYEALNHVLNGDARPMIGCWSHGPDVALSDFCGERHNGWDAVRSHWERLAATVCCGRVTATEFAAGGAGALAYVTATEHVRARVHGQPVRFVSRATTLYALVSGEGAGEPSWRVVHRHADPMPAIQQVCAAESRNPTRSTRDSLA